MNAGLIGSAGSGVVAGGSSAAPTVQATSISFSSVLDVSMTISWTIGNGNARIVVIKAGSAVDSTPVDGIIYESDVIFGAGTQLGSGNYVVYAGSGSSVDVTGLTNGVVYHVRVFEYNQPAFKYMTVTASGNPASQVSASLPTSQATNIVFSNIQATSLDLSLTRGSGSKVLIVAKASVAVNSNPSDNTTYTPNAAFGSGTQIGAGNYVVYAGTSASVTVTGLTFGLTYHFRAYEYGGGAGAEKYLTSTASGNPASQAIDYLGATLIDEWISNYGLTLRTNYGDFLDTWRGHSNGILMGRSGNIPAPVAGILSLNASGVPQLANYSMNVNGAVTFCFLLSKSASINSRVELFAASAATPSFKILLETAVGNTSMGINIAGTYYSTGASFTYDGSYHAIAYTVNPSAGEFKTFMDGAQVGSTVTIPSTSINLTSVDTKSFFTFQFTGNVKKFRIYNEAISASTTAAIVNTANPFFTTMAVHRPAHVIDFWGQSNMVGSGLVNSDLPSYLQGTKPHVYVFSVFARNNTLPGTYPASVGPEVKCTYDLAAYYPDDDIFFAKTASANRSLAVDFNSDPEGSLYDGTRNASKRMINTLLAENRTIVEHSFCGMQGEEDASHLDQANAYEVNLTNLNTNFRLQTGALVHVYGRIHSHMPTTGSNGRPYASTVRAADDAVSVADPDAQTIDTDDNSTGNFEIKTDLVHFNVTGIIKLGQSMASYLISMA